MIMMDLDTSSFMYWSQIRHYGRLSVFKNNNWNNALLASVLKRADRARSAGSGDADTVTEPVMIIIGPGHWSESGEGPYCVL